MSSCRRGSSDVTLGSMPAARFTLEYYCSPDGDEPVRRWIFAKLDAPKRRALVMGLQYILAERGIDVCGTEFGRHLGHGLFEFRLRYDEAALGRRLHVVSPPSGAESGGGPVLLRVFCHAHGSRVILLLVGYDKGDDPSRKRQQREIDVARRRLSDFRTRVRARRKP